MIFSFDLDGTLVDYKNNIHPKTITAIQHARKKGHTTVIATGRPIEGIISVHEQCPVDYWVCSNGATVVEAQTKKIIKDASIEKEIAIEAIDFFRNKVKAFLMHGLHKIQFNYGVITNDYGYQYYNKVYWPVNSDINKLPNEVFQDIKQFAAFGNKISVKNIINAVKNNPKLKFLNIIPIKLATGDYWFDIPVGLNDKGSALKILVKKLGKEKEELYHFGDSYNDMSAMQEFIGIATRYAPSAIQEIAIEVVDERYGEIGKFIEKQINHHK